MKIVNTGSRYVIYDDNLRTFDQLPAQVYELCFDMNSGFFLNDSDPIVVTEKTYGVHEHKVEKILRSFEQFERNLGVILSGAKGIGKSMCAKMIAQHAVEQGYPVILVHRYVPGIASYIDTIKQKVVVIFDEFDKVFSRKGGDDDETSVQMEFLTLFDGMSQGKKMFVVTCNNLYSLSDLMINRPGRFHYHLRFDYPSPTEIKEYLVDKVPGITEDTISEVIAFSGRVDLNYDCLRAIAFELKSGEKFSEAIRDLNIVSYDSNADEYTGVIFFEDGSKAVAQRVRVNISGIPMDYEDEDDSCVRFTYRGGYFVYANIDFSQSYYDQNELVTIVPPEAITDISWTKGYHDDLDDDEIPVKSPIQKVVFKRMISQKDIHYAV